MKRATSFIAVSQPYNGISIHALVKRATLRFWKMKFLDLLFQSTPS